VRHLCLRCDEVFNVGQVGALVLVAHEGVGEARRRRRPSTRRAASFEAFAAIYADIAGTELAAADPEAAERRLAPAEIVRRLSR
jgi:hypothetical protein